MAPTGPPWRRLAELDSRPIPAGDLLIAETGDELVAALSLDTGAGIAEPVPPHRRRGRPPRLPRPRAARRVTVIEASVPSLAASRTEAAPPWKVWTALWIVYIVWGSTYLGIALMVETMPPLLAAGARFLAVGMILLPILVVKRGIGVLRPSRAQLLSAALVGLLLPGANAVISVAEKTVPSGVAALLVASIPLWVILLRAISGEKIKGRSIVAVLVGFGGVALIVNPSGDATIFGLLACVGAASDVGDRLVCLPAHLPAA